MTITHLRCQGEELVAAWIDGIVRPDEGVLWADQMK